MPFMVKNVGSLDVAMVVTMEVSREILRAMSDLN